MKSKTPLVTCYMNTNNLVIHLRLHQYIEKLIVIWYMITIKRLQSLAANGLR